MVSNLGTVVASEKEEEKIEQKQSLFFYFKNITMKGTERKY